MPFKSKSQYKRLKELTEAGTFPKSKFMQMEAETKLNKLPERAKRPATKISVAKAVRVIK